MNVFKAFLKGVGMIFGSFAPRPYRREYNPMKKCANNMNEVRKRFSEVLKRYEERNE